MRGALSLLSIISSTIESSPIIIYAQMQHYRALLDDARYHRLGALRDRFRFLSRDASAWLFTKLDNTDNSSLAPAIRT